MDRRENLAAEVLDLYGPAVMIAALITALICEVSTLAGLKFWAHAHATQSTKEIK